MTLRDMIYDLTVTPRGNSVVGLPTPSNPDGREPGQCFDQTVMCQ